MKKIAGYYANGHYKRAETMVGKKEKRRLLQLTVCMICFLAVFWAKGIDKIAPLKNEFLELLCSNVDFEAAVTDLSPGQPIGSALKQLCVGVFLPKSDRMFYWQPNTGTYRNGKALRIQDNAPMEVLQMDKGINRNVSDNLTDIGEKPLTESEVLGTTKPADTVVYVNYAGKDLPEYTTMDIYTLNLPETVDPVVAVMSSGFGWREHPISGGEKFHYGVDLAVETGTEILAFAAGKVDYIGESDVYGKYLQLDHGNGITTFYAHCSELCVQQGQTVTTGEKIAESGATGDVTGPHLHFEMKKDGVRLNPAYYIQTLP